MSQQLYKLPPDMNQDIRKHEEDVQRYLCKDLAADIFKTRRVPRGIYEQRRDETYMTRIRIAGGAFTPEQARLLAALASEYGNGILHVTTRQDIQLHDINIADTSEIMRRLKTVGLATRGGGGNTVRNVTASPCAGVCPQEPFDVTAFACAVTEYLLSLEGSYHLPRKYKIAFSGCSRDVALATVHDLGFMATTRNGQPGFAVYGGGGMGAGSRIADRLIDFLPAEKAVKAAEAMRRLFDRLGDRENRARARLRHAVRKIGAEPFRQLFLDELERVQHDDTVPSLTELVRQLEIHTVNDSAARCGTVETVHGLETLAQRQKDRVSVALRLVLGDIGWQDLLKLADIAETFSNECLLYATQGQNLLIRSVATARLQDLQTVLATLETNVLDPGYSGRIVSCTGAATCKLGLCLSRNAAMAAAEALDNAGLPPELAQELDIRISGCPNSCGQHPIAGIGLFGAAKRENQCLVPGYRILLGGQTGQDCTRFGTPIGFVPARAVGRFLAELVREFAAKRVSAETFAQYVDRLGTDVFAELVNKHAAIPSYTQGPEFYQDLGASHDFSLAGRQPGECGAGIIALIEDEVQAASQVVKKLANGVREIDAAAAVQAVVRPLLISQGVDTADTVVLFRQFEKLFIHTNLIAAKHRYLLAWAQQNLENPEPFDSQHVSQLRDLFDEVSQLHATMDAKLQFHPVAKQAGQVAAACENKQTAFLDLKGVPCPINFVKAKLAMEDVAPGGNLTLILDEGEPTRKVPASFNADGFILDEITDLGTGHYRIVVSKPKA